LGVSSRLSINSISRFESHRVGRLGSRKYAGIEKAKGAVADAARVRALSQYKQLLDLWKDADPGVSIFKTAKAEYAKLL
jgi:hypothetical protein